MSDGDVLRQLKALSSVIEAQNKAVNARLDAIEKKVAGGQGTSLLLVALVAIIAVIVGFALTQSPAVSNLHNAFSAGGVCKPLTLYRYGVLKNYTGSYPENCVVSARAVLEAANKMFPSPDNNISRILTMTGRDTPPQFDLSDEPLTLITLSAPDREHFMWPIVRIGHTTSVEAGVERQKVTVKTLSAEPRVFQLDNLLTAEECDTFLNTAKAVQQSMEESMVGADHASSSKSLARSSKHTWIGSTFADGSGAWTTNEVIERVEKRIFDLTRLYKDTAEPFQVVFYNMSDYYYGHHDFTDPSHAPGNPYFRGGGNRYLTVLLYLNDVTEGGHTVFPFVDDNGKPQLRHLDPTVLYQGSSACDANGLKVHPRKGGAAMFYNLLENGHMSGAFDKWTVHAGCKPLAGPKYISNKWIRNKRVNGHLYDDVW